MRALLSLCYSLYPFSAFPFIPFARRGIEKMSPVVPFQEVVIASVCCMLRRMTDYFEGREERGGEGKEEELGVAEEGRGDRGLLR